MPKVKWMKGYHEVYPDKEPVMGKAWLNLTNVQESANYTCVAQSDLGNIEADVQVVVTGKKSGVFLCHHHVASIAHR